MKCTIFAIYFDTLGVRDNAISESICIIYVDVDHYKNTLYYLLGVPSVAQINPTELSSYLLIFILLKMLPCDYVGGYYIRVTLIFGSLLVIM